LRIRFVLAGVGALLAGVALADAVRLPADVASGWTIDFNQSLEDGFKPWGAAVVRARDGHPVRLGTQSVRFEVRPGDCGGEDCLRDRGRAELSQSGANRGADLQADGDRFWYAWSLFVPVDFPYLYPTWTHMGQFHQTVEGPNFLFTSGQYRSGGNQPGIYVSNHAPGDGTRPEETALLITDAQTRGRWTDFLVYAEWSSGPNGRFQVFINNIVRYDYRGPTMLANALVYFKFGIYRSYLSRYQSQHGGALPPTQVAYFDEIRRGDTRADVDRVGITFIQTRLAELGFYDRTIDGRWGPRTLAALNAFRVSRGLPAVDTLDAAAFSGL
jgi:hypothetical protein